MKNPGFKTYFLLCLLAGILSALSMAPWGIVPALFAGLSVLYISVTLSPRPLHAFFYGWAFGFGYFLFGLLWVGNALLVDGNPYAWAWPLAVCGLPFALAFFSGFACVLARRFADLHSISGFITFVAITAFFEWARGHVFTGFPWNLYGHMWAKILPMLQVLSFSDVYWLTAVTISWCALPGFLYVSKTTSTNKKLLTLCLAASFVFCLSFGFWRLQQPVPAGRDDIRIHLVQANIPQSQKWERDKLWPQFLKQIRLSLPDDDSTTTTYIIWPETALSPWVLNEPRAMYQIKHLLSQYKGKAYLIAGLLRHTKEDDRYYNSLAMIDAAGTVSNVYDKNHLVPFGEYIPFQKWIPLEPVARFRGFAGGSGPQTFTTPEGIKYSPDICYEIIFSGEVVNHTEPPDFILNVTNDSWYGLSAGPWQHLYQAVFRAIEEGIPVVRVADTGISAIIAPDGHILEKSALFQEYEKTLALPGHFMDSSKNKTITTGAFLSFLLFLVWLGILTKRNSKS